MSTQHATQHATQQRTTELGIKVKDKLNRTNMKQRQLAELIGVTPQMLSSVLRGNNSSLLLEEWLDDWVNDKPFRKYSKVNRNEGE